jgi:2,5-diamino-6-(ribosylamino)-4(3H)-pyrimidinone 5'-phosphate reductase
VKEKYVTSPKNPIRIVLDSKCRVPEGALVLDGKAPTIIAVLDEHYRDVPGAEVIPIEKDPRGQIDLNKFLETLHLKGVKTLLVEGGETVIWSFLQEHLVDELFVFIGSMIIGGTRSPTMAGGEGAQSYEQIIQLKLESAIKVGQGVLLHYLL